MHFAGTQANTINLKPQHQRTWEVFIFFSCKWSKEFHHLCFLFSKAVTTEQSLWLFDPQPPIWLKPGFVKFIFFLFPPCVSQMWITRFFLQHKPFRGVYLKAIGKWCHRTGLIQSALIYPNFMCLISNRKKSGLLSF